MTATPSDPDLRVLHLPTGETIRILASAHDDGDAALEVDALLPPGLPGPPRPRGGRPGGACVAWTAGAMWQGSTVTTAVTGRPRPARPGPGRRRWHGPNAAAR